VFIGTYRFSSTPNFNVEFVEIRLIKLDNSMKNFFYRFKGEVNIFRKGLSGSLKNFAFSLSSDAKYITIKRVFPCKILIYVVERTPFLQIKTKKGIFTIDKDFVILGGSSRDSYLKGEKSTHALPTVIGLEEELAGAGKHYKLSLPRLKVIRELLNSYNNSALSKRLFITAIDVKQANRLTVILSDGTSLILDENSLRDGFNSLPRIFSELRKNHINPKYIDLRIKEPVIGT
jgi:cell division septal protein FtsQ